jgi:hypothetical protein
MSRTVTEQLAGTPTRYTPPTCQTWNGHEYIPAPVNGQCTHANGFHNPGGAVISAAPGFKRRRDGSVWLDTSLHNAPRPIPARTCENIAACAAVGLSYWSEAPNARLWAVDDHQHAHEIRIDRKAAKVQNLTGEYVAFDTPTSDQLLVDAANA